MISKGWVQAVLIVILAGFAGLLYLAYATYKDEPPIPKRALSPSGHVLFTGSDVTSGQKVFLSNGLMEFGSIFGHGAYLGPDFTADYLHRAAHAHPGGLRRQPLGCRTPADDLRLSRQPLRQAHRDAAVLRRASERLPHA